MAQQDFVRVSGNDEGSMNVEAGSGDPIRWETISKGVDIVRIGGMAIRAPKIGDLGSVLLEGYCTIEVESESTVKIEKE